MQLLEQLQQLCLVGPLGGRPQHQLQFRHEQVDGQAILLVQVHACHAFRLHGCAATLTTPRTWSDLKWITAAGCRILGAR